MAVDAAWGARWVARALNGGIKRLIVELRGRFEHKIESNATHMYGTMLRRAFGIHYQLITDNIKITIFI